MRAIVPFQVITNVGETRTLWSHSLMGMNVRTSHLRVIICAHMYIRDMQNLGVVRV